MHPKETRSGHICTALATTSYDRKAMYHLFLLFSSWTKLLEVEYRRSIFRVFLGHLCKPQPLPPPAKIVKQVDVRLSNTIETQATLKPLSFPRGAKPLRILIFCNQQHRLFSFARFLSNIVFLFFGRTDGRTVGRSDGRTVGRTDGRTDEDKVINVFQYHITE